jgi:hypothetical protein
MPRITEEIAMMMLKFDEIQADPEVFASPRWLDGDIEGLARQILVDGMKEPLLVWRKDDQPYLVDGWRRFAALEWIQREHPDVFAMRFAQVGVEEARGDEFEVLLQVVRRNLQERSFNLADLANGVHQLFSGFWIADIAMELDLDNRLVEAALRLRVSVPDEAFAEFARVSTSIDDLSGLLGQKADVALAEIRALIKEHHTKLCDLHGAGRGRGAGQPGAKKYPKPKVAELREARDKAVEELRVFRADYERAGKPTVFTGLPEDGAGAWELIVYRSEDAKLTARSEALDWVLGERPDLK